MVRDLGAEAGSEKLRDDLLTRELPRLLGEEIRGFAANDLGPCIPEGFKPVLVDVDQHAVRVYGMHHHRRVVVQPTEAVLALCQSLLDGGPVFDVLKQKPENGGSYRESRDEG